MNDMIIALLTNLSHSFGGSLGWAIVLLSLVIRVALLPLTISLARRARRNQEILQRLQPEINRLRQRYETKPERLFEEMRKLYRQARLQSVRHPDIGWKFHPASDFRDAV